MDKRNILEGNVLIVFRHPKLKKYGERLRLILKRIGFTGTILVKPNANLLEAMRVLDPSLLFYDEKEELTINSLSPLFSFEKVMFPIIPRSFTIPGEEKGDVLKQIHSMIFPEQSNEGYKIHIPFNHLTRLFDYIKKHEPNLFFISSTAPDSVRKEIERFIKEQDFPSVVISGVKF